jgi:hypothetical protein
MHQVLSLSLPPSYSLSLPPFPFIASARAGSQFLLLLRVKTLYAKSLFIFPPQNLIDFIRAMIDYSAINACIFVGTFNFYFFRFRFAPLQPNQIVSRLQTVIEAEK